MNEKYYRTRPNTCKWMVDQMNSSLLKELNQTSQEVKKDIRVVK